MIRFEQVTKRFGRKTVLDDVSFEIARGETFVIVGLSGAGKSVSLRHMVRLLTPESGRVWVGDDCVSEADQRVEVGDEVEHGGGARQGQAAVDAVGRVARQQGAAARAAGRLAGGEGGLALEQVAFVAGDQVGRQEGVRIRRQHGRPRENDGQFCGAALPGRKGGGPK